MSSWEPNFDSSHEPSGLTSTSLLERDGAAAAAAAAAAQPLLLLPIASELDSLGVARADEPPREPFRTSSTSNVSSVLMGGTGNSPPQRASASVNDTALSVFAEELKEQSKHLAELRDEFRGYRA